MTTSRTRKTASSAAKKSTGATGAPATKKSSAKKSSAKKSSATKSSASTAKKATADGSDSDDATGSEATTAPRKRASAPRAAAKPKPKAVQIARDAAQQLRELTGKDIEGITGFTATDDGWSVEVEVVEVRRIPNTTDVLALYEVTVDESGAMEGYRRQRRYARGVAREG